MCPAGPPDRERDAVVEGAHPLELGRAGEAVRSNGDMRPLAFFALLGLVVLPSCGSDARGVDTCRKIEAARCQRGPACVTNFAGDVDSCTRFYDLQCGRGLQDSVREPSAAELNGCLEAIKTSCTAVNDPAKEPACSFITGNAPVDTGVVTEAATDAGNEAATDTGTTETGPTDTGIADTGTVDTGSAADSASADAVDAD